MTNEEITNFTPLSQLSEAGMCKTSRMVEKKLGNILKKGEVKSTNFFRAWICRDVIQQALRYKIKNGACYHGVHEWTLCRRWLY